MYKNSNAFYPSRIYLNINFDEIKRKLKNINNVNIKDYGSIIFMDIGNCMFAINHLGKIDFYYNSKNNLQLENNLKKIENIFKQQIKEFNIVM
ncbi:hypothetical protein ACJDT4_12420 [Clostridium neuense]|uniref:Uncharacterized protein n=1 Tax=Clostridium neuense TaxID=1728934 RepID=A0ABW8TFR1_9CLOT